MRHGKKIDTPKKKLTHRKKLKHQKKETLKNILLRHEKTQQRTPESPPPLESPDGSLSQSSYSQKQPYFSIFQGGPFGGPF